MYHLRRIKVLLAACVLASASLWAQDTKLEISSAVATSENSGEGAANVVDGKTDTFWHSNWSWGPVFNSVSSVDLTITLSSVSLVDYVRYIPRQDRLDQGCWGEVELFYCPSTSGTDFTSLGTFQLGMTGTTYDFYLNGMEGGVQCGQIKFTIRSGGNNHATAAEIEAYAYNREKPAAFAQYFSDDLYTQLNSDVTSSDGIADADVKALVDNILSGADDYKKFRVGEYEPYMTTATVKSNLKLSSQYNNYENPTGIYLEEGQSCYVAVSGIGDYSVGLKIRNWYLSEAGSSYTLHNGLNYITATTEGNVFVNYYTDEFEQAPNVKVHFINAPVIGYWDQETMTNEDWVDMLADKAADDNRIIITRSEHAQLAFPVSAWKNHCPDNVDSTMTLYQQVQWAERDILGLEKYNRQVKNRQLYYATNYGFMAAGDDGAYCNVNSLGAIMKPDSRDFDLWGVGHEWGHNNQMTPGFKWSGCGETTNNIPASWAQFHFTGNRDADGNPTYLRLEDETSGIDEYAGMRGGRMQVYFEEGLRKGVAWQLQDGADYHGASLDTEEVDEYDADGNATGNKVPKNSRNYDHFVKLSPFWQLNLWGTLAGKSPEIIQKVIESIRTTEGYGTTYNTNGKQQINWMKLACDVTQINLLPFFEKAGMLRPIHAYIEDYDAGWNIITEEMINELKEYVAGKGYSDFTEEINYINGHNYRTYRDNLKLNVTAIDGWFSGDKVTIQHSVAQNAVAFETYNADDELIRITMYGLGSDDAHSYTKVLYPSSEGANYIMAVGYDGERQKVYQERDTQELQALIEKAEALMGEIGEVADEYSEQEVNLSAGNYYCNALYTGSEVNDKFTSYDVLCDGNPDTYLHTDYSSSAPTEDHYVTIDLGSGNELTFFDLTYKTRKEGSVHAPSSVVIEGSNDKATWALLREVSSGLKTGSNQENTIVELGDGTPYRYIRMKVLATGSDTRYFVLSELGLSELQYEVNLEPDYSLIFEGVVVATHNAIQSAQEKITEGKEYTNAYVTLQKMYNALSAARQEMDRVNAAKTSLLDLIGRTESLINTCGTVTYTPEAYDGKLALQTNDENADFYLYCNAPYLDNSESSDYSPASEGYYILDGDYGTYLHTDWSENAPEEDHYLRVFMGEASMYQFILNYSTRGGGNNITPGNPTEIVVEGCDTKDGNYTTIATLTSNDSNPLPKGDALTHYESGELGNGTAYKYIRFRVTMNQGNSKQNEHHWFYMSEFGVTAIGHPESYEATVGDNAGEVTEELMIAAYKQNQEAQVSYKTAATESQVQKAIDKLQAQYDALSDAKNSVKYVDYTISANVNGGGVVYEGENYTTDLTAPSTVTFTVEDAIALDGYVAKNVTLEGTTITVIYNKVYTVQVIGGGGNGGVTYNEHDYADGETLDAQQASFTAEDLTAIVPEGYTLKEMTVDHETGVISVSYAAIPLVDTTKYYTLACKATDHGAYIRDLGTSINGRSAEGSLFRFEPADEDNGYYIKSYVSEKYLNYVNSAVVAGEENLTVWTMDEFSKTENEHVVTLTVGNNLYLNNNGDDNTDSSCTNLQAKNHTMDGGSPQSGNACSLWILTESEPIDMSDLAALIDATNILIASCYTGDVLNYVNSAYVTEASLTTVRSVVADAQAKYDSKATVASEYAAAMTALQSAKETLSANIASAETEAAERAQLRTDLNTLIGETNELITLCGTTPGDATETLINEVSALVASAQTVANNTGSTADELTAATTALQAKYDVLNAAQQSTAKADLRTLIAQTTALIDDCGVVVNGSHPIITSITLQTTDANAANYLSTNAQETYEGPIGNLLINDGSFFHSSWTATVGAAHYLQVDMGEGQSLQEFVFSYTTRDGGPHPHTIVVSGSNTNEDNSYVKLATFDTGLPTAGSASWNEDGEHIISASEAYRYLRFTVTQSSSKHGSGEYFFAMSKFGLGSVSYETSYYVESMHSYGNVAEELLIEVVRTKDAAEELADNSYDKEAIETAIEELQALYRSLEDAHNDYSYLPVTLTADMEAPVLYTIGSKRGDTKVLQYDPADEHMFSIVDASAGNAKQLFYFTKGSKHGQVFIHPFAAGEQVLAATSTTNATAAAWATPKDTMTHQEWTIPIVNSENGTYNIKAADGSNYFSNNSGEDYKMGFWSGNNTTDPGSLFTFTQTTIERSSAYHSLKVYYEEALEDLTNKNPGHYGATPAFTEACENATELLAGSADYATYLEAYRALRAANESLVIIVPEAGKFYRIKNNGGTGYLSGDAATSGRVQFVADISESASSVFYFTGTKLLSYSTGLYLAKGSSENFVHYTQTIGEGAGTTFVFKAAPVAGKLLIEFMGNRSFYSAGTGNSDAASSGQTGDNYRFTIEEVTSLPVSVNENLGFASFYAPVALTMPEGMTAYVVTDLDGDKAPIEVLAEAGETIPANTGVLLAAEGGDYTLTIAHADDANEVEGTNLLNGSIDDQYIEYGNNTHYVLGYKNNLAGLYQVSKNLTSTGVKDDANGTHFKNNGFKSYLTVPGSAGVAALRLYRGATTEIEEAEVGGLETEMIYDLAGRRVLNPTKGMYIVNGKKVVIK